jgi:hypothetical protein
MGSVLSVGVLIPAFIAAIIIDLLKRGLSRLLRHLHRSASPGTPDSHLVRDPEENSTRCRECFGLAVARPTLLAPYAINVLHPSTGTVELFAIVDEQLPTERSGNTAILPGRLPTAESSRGESAIRPASMWVAQHRWVPGVRESLVAPAPTASDWIVSARSGMHCFFFRRRRGA